MNKKEKTYLAILDASWHLFNEQGYHETTTRQISKQAGVATGTVFSHFSSKADILTVAMHRKIEGVIHYAASLDTHHTPRLKLRHFAKHLYAFYLENREFSKELVVAILWKQTYFLDQLEDFKLSLFSETQYDATQANIMMDCYFMTLLQGLCDETQTVDEMVRILSNKLHLIQK
jgi:AcrR family transcriptional regulator